ncbi:hypothetical protein BDF19DRAFT_26078 [Syncephalis fuscata]|nr:hypothetical protein BDF19DRAFT_26078 [Syncephalis fuscata]
MKDKAKPLNVVDKVSAATTLSKPTKTRSITEPRRMVHPSSTNSTAVPVFRRQTSKPITKPTNSSKAITKPRTTNQLSKPKPVIAQPTSTVSETLPIQSNPPPNLSTNKQENSKEDVKTPHHDQRRRSARIQSRVKKRPLSGNTPSTPSKMIRKTPSTRVAPSTQDHLNPRKRPALQSPEPVLEPPKKKIAQSQPSTISTPSNSNQLINNDKISTTNTIINTTQPINKVTLNELTPIMVDPLLIRARYVQWQYLKAKSAIAWKEQKTLAQLTNCKL